jgi:hypothetical protein
MIKSCARGFLEGRGIAQYEFSGEHVLERINRPLVESGLIRECENNNFVIPEDSKLHKICETEINGKAHIILGISVPVIYRPHNCLFSFSASNYGFFKCSGNIISERMILFQL